MAVSKIYIDPKKKKKNGEATIYILVHIDYKSVKFNTGVSCMPDDFDLKNSRIKGNSKKVKDDNLIVETCLSRLNEVFVRYRLQNINLTPELLKNEWKNPTRRIDFHSFFNEALEERKGDITVGTYRSNKSFGKKLKTFRPKLAFTEINADFIDSFARWLKASPQNNSINTIHLAMRRFRTYLYIAVKKGIITRNPFTEIKLKKVSTDRVSLTQEELTVLWNLYNKHELSKSLHSVLRHFLFMCFTGIRISDLKAITHDNVISKMLVFTVKKTINTKQGFLRIPLCSQALKLIIDEPEHPIKLFDVISDQKMNDYIKNICKLDTVKIYKNVSNHTGRHTFATLWLKKTKDLAALQRLLGHSDIKETMIYVHVDDQLLIEDMTIFQNNIFKSHLQPTTKNPGPMPGIFPN